jgi:hypothetical protein
MHIHQRTPFIKSINLVGNIKERFIIQNLRKLNKKQKKFIHIINAIIILRRKIIITFIN